MRNLAKMKVPIRWREMKISQTYQFRIFLTLAILSVVQGLVMAGLGILIKFQTGEWLRHEVQKDPVGRLYTPFFKPDKASTSAPLQLLSQNIASTMLYLGLAVILISDLGLAGALYLRTLLALFMLMMPTLILTEIVSVTVLVDRKSFLSLQAKKAASLTLEDQAEFTDPEKDHNIWLNGLHLLMVKLDCCGVNGPEDFAALYCDKFVPETCCRRELVENVKQQKVLRCRNRRGRVDKGLSVGDHSVTNCAEDDPLTDTDLWNCTRITPSYNDLAKLIKSKGCYDAIFDVIFSSLPWLVPLVIFILLTQVTTVAGSMYVFNQKLTLTRTTQTLEPV